MPSGFSVGTPGWYFPELFHLRMSVCWFIPWVTIWLSVILMDQIVFLSKLRDIVWFFWHRVLLCQRIKLSLFFPSCSWSFFFLLRPLGNFLYSWIWKRYYVSLLIVLYFFLFCLNASYSLYIQIWHISFFLCLREVSPYYASKYIFCSKCCFLLILSLYLCLFLSTFTCLYICKCSYICTWTIYMNRCQQSSVNI